MWYNVEKCRIGESDMQRTIYVYELKFESSKGKNVIVPDSYVEDMADILKKVNSFDLKDKTEHFKSDCKVAYIETVSHDVEGKLLELTFKSAKYGMVRTVIDTETYENKGFLKKRPDGDLEKTHIMMKFVDNSTAIALYEYNRDGIGLTKIMGYINRFIKKYHHEKSDMIYYSITHKNVVSRDFLKSLEKINRIKAVTLTVAREDVNVSETKAFAGYRDLSEDMELVFKPTGKGNTIFGNTVKDFYEIYTNKRIPIKRITVDGDRVTKEPLVFDTEKMKEKYPVEIAEDRNGEAISEDVFEQMKEISHYF